MAKDEAMCFAMVVILLVQTQSRHNAMIPGCSNCTDLSPHSSDCPTLSWEKTQPFWLASFWMNTAWYKLKSISASWLSYSCICDPLLNLFSILLFSYGNRTERSTGLGISWPVVRVSLLKLYLANVLSSRTMHMVCWLSE